MLIDGWEPCKKEKKRIKSRKKKPFYIHKSTAVDCSRGACVLSRGVQLLAEIQNTTSMVFSGEG